MLFPPAHCSLLAKGRFCFCFVPFTYLVKKAGAVRFSSLTSGLFHGSWLTNLSVKEPDSVSPDQRGSEISHLLDFGQRSVPQHPAHGPLCRRPPATTWGPPSGRPASRTPAPPCATRSSPDQTVACFHDRKLSKDFSFKLFFVASNLTCFFGGGGVSFLRQCWQCWQCCELFKAVFARTLFMWSNLFGPIWDHTSDACPGV